MSRVELDVVLHSSKTFSQLIDASCAFIEKTVLECSAEEGMKVCSLDHKDVGLVKWCWKAACFRSYKCIKKSAADPLNIPLDFNQLIVVLKNAEQNELVTLRKYALEDTLTVIF